LRIALKKEAPLKHKNRLYINYIDEHPDLQLYDTYVDANISGTTFERPGFQRLLHDAETGKIRCVIVKDISRLVRNAIETGYYIERAFPQLGLRLISLGDNYDSKTDQVDIKLSLMNVLNEAYVLDISRKRRSQARQAMKDGIYVGGHPPYGYVRSTEDRHKLIAEPSSAMIVKQIYQWTLDGMSTHEIVRKLNALKIPSPASHKKDCSTAGRWYARTVERILENEIYQGTLIQGKTKTKNFQRQPTTSDEWIYAYDTHEAIVPPEMFQAVQSISRLRQESSKSKPTASYTENIYKGKIYSAHCVGRMERRKNHDYYVFRCVANRTTPDSCVGNHIREDAVKDALSAQLIRLSGELSEQQNTPSQDADILPELRFIEMELSRLQNLTRSLYENLVTGIIDNTDYSELKSGYQVQIDEFKQREVTLQKALDDEKRGNKHRQESLQILDVYADTLKLALEHIDRFVDRVIISRDSRVHIELVV
jgi:DNA invertase Pin-like site-specific DNA recombinase